MARCTGFLNSSKIHSTKLPALQFKQIYTKISNRQEPLLYFHVPNSLPNARTIFLFFLRRSQSPTPPTNWVVPFLPPRWWFASGRDLQIAPVVCVFTRTWAVSGEVCNMWTQLSLWYIDVEKWKSDPDAERCMLYTYVDLCILHSL